VSLSTHVLDTARGRPATGVPVRLSRLDGPGRAAGGPDETTVAEGRTDDDGRLRFQGVALDSRTYRLTFDTAAYLGPDAFFPEVAVVFTVHDPGGHYHVPLLLSPFGYSTYRGS
jgi:5-hydroxyisourate hydrolase